ncbi:peptidylprolyl isomerase [Plantactinospora soyae]|uniref:Peptidyl-prolyl cis-trans isomerase B (Cyclophilin B) n=1 Tax=Plantactinospora soyae TaxID=1544732 RepID=A0A927M6Y9_9ACTN|nr:peptidylprolyl isomerase [Plantactinospora soyae]MBE1488899.1 peptidyl-prolyl cis-trans isomerase B (cyclophilin B) [Plantactinospora soyae]
MASSRDRQRKLARAKLDRQMARRAASARRKRQVRAGIGSAVALLLIVLGSFWALGGFDNEPTDDTATSEVCTWSSQDAQANTSLKDVGVPPTTNPPTTGTQPMTITTNQGAPVTVDLDLVAAPCAGASFAHLAGKAFFDNTKCHEITAEGAVRCGDPTGTGQGGPAYTFFSENVPNAPAPDPSATPSTSATPATDASASPSASAPPGTAPQYPAGTVALIGNPPGANGSQFLIFFKDFTTAEPRYPVIGKVTAGLDVIKKVGAAETMDNGSGELTKPKTDVVIQSLTVGEPASGDPTAVPSAATPSAAPSGSPTVAGQP